MPPAAWIALASLAAVIFIQTAVVAFALGRLFQRVTQIETSIVARQADGETLIRLTVQMEHVETTLTKLVSHSENTSRQLGNIAMGRVGHIVEMGSDR